MTTPSADAIAWQLARMEPINGREPTREDALAVLVSVETGGPIPFAIEPQRDISPTPTDGTHFVPCHPDRAQHWALFLMHEGESEWVADFPTVQAARLHLEALGGFEA